MSAKWPSSVATDADLYVAVNSLQTTLSTAINSSDASVVLASATGFPAAGGVTIDNEVIFYTGVSGATLTGCTRGADGTTAASHSVGVPVGASIIAFHHNGLKAEIEAIESYLDTVLGKGTTVTATEFAYVHGVTSAIQTQMDLKAPKASPTFTGTVTIPTPFTVGAVSVTATGTEMNYLVGVSSAIQTQLGLKATDSLVVHLAGTESITGAKTFSSAVVGPNGSVSAPGHTFVGNTGTGIYRGGVGNALAVAVNGVDACYFTEAASPQLQVSGGSVTLPTYAFGSEPDCGMYVVGTNSIGLSTNGTRALVITSAQAVQIKGTATNDNATAGDYGEVISSSVTSYANSASNNVYGNITSISLTAGHWFIIGQVQTNLNSATMTRNRMAISVNSGNTTSDQVTGVNDLDISIPTAASNVGGTMGYTLKLSGPTTVYLKQAGNFSVATPQYLGSIYATRVR